MLKGSSDPRYNEVQIETNCIGPCLLFKLLLPILTKTAASSPTSSVRVLWAGSIAVQTNSPQPAGMVVDDTGRPKDTDVLSSYGQSKVGNVFLAREYAKATPQTGVVHACFNPGNLRTGLQRHWSGIVIMLMVSRLPSYASRPNTGDDLY
jgi:retinol dehydrogenase-12